MHSTQSGTERDVNFYPITTCKHCGCYLGHDERSEAVRRGLDSDECAVTVRCAFDAHGAASPIYQAFAELSQLADKWADRDADAQLAAMTG